MRGGKLTRARQFLRRKGEGCDRVTKLKSRVEGWGAMQGKETVEERRVHEDTDTKRRKDKNRKKRD